MTVTFLIEIIFLASIMTDVLNNGCLT